MGRFNKNKVVQPSKKHTVKVIVRKKQRKEARKFKKKKKADFFNQRITKPSLDPPVGDEVLNESDDEIQDTPHDQLSIKEQEKKYKESIKKEDEREKKIEKKQVAKERKMLMKEDNEDVVIKDMGRKLKLHKRRKTQSAIPKSFYADGLGDLLEFVDKRNVSDGEGDNEGDDDEPMSDDEDNDDEDDILEDGEETDEEDSEVDDGDSGENDDDSKDGEEEEEEEKIVEKKKVLAKRKPVKAIQSRKSPFRRRK